MAKTLYVIDGHAQIYRAFYAPFRDLTSPSGEPTRATYVFCQMLFNLLRQRRPDYLAMTLDVSDETVFRREIDPNYKGHREAPPEAFDVQHDRILSIVETLGIPVFRLPGFEADDLMATIAEQVRVAEVDVYLVSRDKDLEQLINDRVRLYDPGKDEEEDAASMEATKGYRPDQAVDVQTLAGDSTDNVPGIPGVGIKTAAKLIHEYGTAEAVLAHAKDLTPKLRERVEAFAAQLPITRQLVTLRKDAPLRFDLQDCRRERFTIGAVRPVFKELGFHRLLEAVDEFDGRLPLEGPPSAEPARTAAPGRGRYHLVDSPEKFAAFLRELKDQRVFAFDTETTGLHPLAAELVGLSLSWKAGEAWYLPVRAAMGDVLPEALIVESLKPIFEDAAVRKVGQNLKFDAQVMARLGIETAPLHFDTMIAAFLLDPLGPHGLDAMVRSMIGHEMIPITDLIGKGKNQITMEQVDTSRACEYAAEDADFTWRLYEILDRRMSGSHAERLFRDTEMPLVEVLVHMERNGIALDAALLRRLGDRMTDRMQQLVEDIQGHAGHRFNVDSTKQLAAVLFDEQGLSVVRKTKTGRSTDADTLEALAAQSNHPIPKLVLEYRELSKLKGTYVDTLPRMVNARTGRVHAAFHQTGAVTGRLSSSDPNLQNIPIRSELGRQIRGAFVAGDAEHVLLSADYSQVELRILAHFCKDAALLDAFRQGLDIHRAVAAKVNGIALDAVTPAQRSAAKAVNFGIIYGQTPFGLSRTLGISSAQAKSFIAAYFAQYPGIRAFIDRCVQDAKRNGYAETMLGRRRPIPELDSRNPGQVAFGERIAVNTVVQGSAADLIKRAMVDIHRANRGRQSAARMLIQVHDELVFEVPRDSVEAEAAQVRERMSSALPLDVALEVDTSWGNNWAEGKT
jgi:DNA polymerase-1